MEDETMERVYEAEEEHHFLRHKGASPAVSHSKLTLKILLNLNPSPNPKLKPKTVSTLLLSMNVKNVMQKLEIK